MKRFLFAPLLLLASLALACATFMADRVSDGYSMGKALIHATRNHIANAIDFGLQLFANEPSGRNPSVRIVQAKAFVQRLVKRERPVVTASWRACPSI